MDGENNGKPYFLTDDLGGFNPLFLETPNCIASILGEVFQGHSVLCIAIIVASPGIWESKVRQRSRNLWKIHKGSEMDQTNQPGTVEA